MQAQSPDFAEIHSYPQLLIKLLDFALRQPELWVRVFSFSLHTWGQKLNWGKDLMQIPMTLLAKNASFGQTANVMKSKEASHEKHSLHSYFLLQFAIYHPLKKFQSTKSYLIFWAGRKCDYCF